MNVTSQYLLLLCSLLVIIQSYALPAFDKAEVEDDEALDLEEKRLWEEMGEAEDDGKLFDRLTRGGDQPATFSRDRRRACVSDCSFCHSFFPTYKLGNCFHGCRKGFHDLGCKQFRY